MGGKKNREKLQGILNKRTKKAISKPSIFDLSRVGDCRYLTKLLVGKNKFIKILDNYLDQEKEYFAVKHPILVNNQRDFRDQFKQYYLDLQRQAPLWQQGCWVYYPWKETFVHVLKEKQFFEVRTSRNRYLITPEEQNIFYNSLIGVVGLSVGNSAALSIVLQGGAKHIKIADHDRLALSNLNRIRTSIEDLGLLKTEMTAREIYTINPYAEVEIFSDGLNKENIFNFFKNVDIVVDEVDDFQVKLLLRRQAKKQRVAVISAIDNGDGGFIGIERYDQKPKQGFFLGRLGNITLAKLSKLNKVQIGALIVKLIGEKNMPYRMMTSALEVGKSLVSWPQLGGTAQLNGAIVAFCVRKILNNQNLDCGDAIFSLDEKLSKCSPEEEKDCVKVSAEFRKFFRL